MPGYGNVFVDALAGESWIEVGRDAHITWRLSDAYGLGWSDAHRAEFAAALASYAAVANITFAMVASDSAADLVEYRVTTAQFAAAFPSSPYGAHKAGWAGYHYGPHDVEGTSDAARGYYDANKLNSWLILHELGHGLGLEHPHTTIHGAGLFPGVKNGKSNDLGAYGLNNTLNTVMSYNTLKGYGGIFDGPMALDIAALQAMYGTNSSTATGNGTYVVARGAYKAIWDAGGTDWLVAGTDNGAYIDLRPATLELGAGAGGWLSRANGYAGGYTIAHGVEIENARGGSGNDILVGNHLINILEGGAGDDVYITDDADDIIIDTSGLDAIVSSVSASLVGRDGIERLFLTGSATHGTGNSLDNGLFGNGAANTLDGREGNDWLVGGRGKDTLIGGEGADVFVYKHVKDSLKGWAKRDEIVDFERGVDLINMKAIDAKKHDPGNDKFKWIGKSKFHHVEGELRYVQKSGFVLVEGDTNGDGRADFQIQIDGVWGLGKGDFIL